MQWELRLPFFIKTKESEEPTQYGAIQASVMQVPYQLHWQLLRRSVLTFPGALTPLPELFSLVNDLFSIKSNANQTHYCKLTPYLLIASCHCHTSVVECLFNQDFDTLSSCYTTFCYCRSYSDLKIS